MVTSGRLRYLRRRSRERGAAVFIVVMVITLLTAVGIFAVRSASLVDMAAGYDRQMVQTEYVAQLGTLATAAELGSGTARAYIDQMATGTDDCRATEQLKEQLKATAPATLVPCYKLFRAELAKRVEQNNVGSRLLEPTLYSDDHNTLEEAGSLGHAPLEGNFVIEMTDPGPVEKPIPGESAGGAPKFLNFLNVTLSGYGQVRTDTGSETCDPGSTATAAVQTVRAHAVIGPF
jgi:hypothetical protein